MPWQIPKENIRHREEIRKRDVDIQALVPILTLASSYQIIKARDREEREREV